MDREEFERLRELLSTPIDFDRLVEEGVLEKAGTWWKVLDMSRLPEHARRQIVEIRAGGDGPGFVRFSRTRLSGGEEGGR